MKFTDTVLDMGGWKMHIRVYRYEGLGKTAEQVQEIKAWVQQIEFTHPLGRPTWRHVRKGPTNLRFNADCEDHMLWEETYLY